MKEMKTPLILVFYIDKTTPNEIVKQMREGVDFVIESKNINAVAIFMPTDGNERVECVNPEIVTQETLDKADKLVSELAKSFNIDVN